MMTIVIVFFITRFAGAQLSAAGNLSTGLPCAASLSKTKTFKKVHTQNQNNRHLNKVNMRPSKQLRTVDTS